MVPSVASEKKSPATPPGMDSETLRLVAQCLNHYATSGPPTYRGKSRKLSTDVLFASDHSQNTRYYSRLTSDASPTRYVRCLSNPVKILNRPCFIPNSRQTKNLPAVWVLNLVSRSNRGTRTKGSKNRALRRLREVERIDVKSNQNVELSVFFIHTTFYGKCVKKS